MTSKSVDVDYIIKNQVSKLKNEIDRAKAAYLSEVFTLEEYAKTKSDCENKLSSIKANTNTETRDIKPEIKNALKEIETEMSPAKKRLILSRFIRVIRVCPDGVEIDF